MLPGSCQASRDLFKAQTTKSLADQMVRVEAFGCTGAIHQADEQIADGKSTTLDHKIKQKLLEKKSKDRKVSEASSLIAARIAARPSFLPVECSRF